MRPKLNNSRNSLLWIFVITVALLSPLSVRYTPFMHLSHYTVYLLLILTLITGFKKGKLMISKEIEYLIFMVMMWLLITVFDSFIFHRAFGTINGQDTFQAILGSSYFHLFYLMSFVVIVKYINTKNDYLIIEKAMDSVTDLSIFIGLLQLGIVFNLPLVRTLYSIINVFGIFVSDEFVSSTGRVMLTGSEPSSLGNLLCVFIMPYLFMQIHSSKKKTIYFYRLAMCYIFAFFSRSTTTYILIVVITIVFAIKEIIETKPSKRRIVFLVSLPIILILVIFFLVLGTPQLGFLGDEDDVYSIRYILLHKVFDMNNMSSAHRWTTPINDLMVFKDYPLTGVGDGNQGFFYSQNISNDLAINIKTQAYLKGQYGVVNGGAFFFAVLSGCGLLGQIPLFRFIKIYHHKYKESKNNNKYCMWFSYALVPIILALLTTGMAMPIVFVLTIPFWSVKNNRE